jgi:hypothetical protein
MEVADERRFSNFVNVTTVYVLPNHIALAALVPQLRAACNGNRKRCDEVLLLRIEFHARLQLSAPPRRTIWRKRFRNRWIATFRLGAKRR